MNTENTNHGNPKKEEVRHRIEKLDPNNNKNLPNKPEIKKLGKKVTDDGFEHRSSGDPVI